MQGPSRGKPWSVNTGRGNIASYVNVTHEAHAASCGMCISIVSIHYMYLYTICPLYYM